MSGEEILSKINTYQIEPVYTPLKTIEDVWDMGHAADAVPFWVIIVAWMLGVVLTQQALLVAFGVSQANMAIYVLSIVSGILLSLMFVRTVRLVKCQLYLPILNHKIRENDLAKAAAKTDDSRKYMASIFRELEKVGPGLQASTESLAKAEAQYQAEDYVGYWDTLEKALWNMQTYSTSIHALKQAVEGYKASIQGNKHNFPKTPVRSGDVGDLQVLLEQLKKVARLGRNNKKCGETLEQRWVRKALFNGFKTVPEAVEHARSTLTEEMAGLRRTTNL